MWLNGYVSFARNFHAKNIVIDKHIFWLHFSMFTFHVSTNTTIWILLLFLYIALSNNHWEIPLWRERSQLSFLKLGFVVTLILTFYNLRYILSVNILTSFPRNKSSNKPWEEMTKISRKTGFLWENKIFCSWKQLYICPGESMLIFK